MTKLHFSTRCALALLVGTTFLTACVDNNARYDKNGNYISPDSPYGISQGVPAHNPRMARDNYSAQQVQKEFGSTSRYEQQGMYDHNGDYIVSDNPINVPQSMFPGRGMCRVWFTNRVPSSQPAIESCEDIKARVPVGAYVIYGG